MIKQLILIRSILALAKFLITITNYNSLQKNEYNKKDDSEFKAKA